MFIDPNKLNWAYKTLNVNPNTDFKQVKASYRKLSKKYHPDITSLDKKSAELKMSEINEAYSILEKKDKGILNTNPFSNNSGSNYTYRSRRGDNQGINISDIFDDILSNFGMGGFGVNENTSAYNRRSNEESRYSKPNPYFVFNVEGKRVDPVFKVSIPIGHTWRFTQIEHKLKINKICDCMSKCLFCNKKGWVETTVKININIPPLAKNLKEPLIFKLYYDYGLNTLAQPLKVFLSLGSVDSKSIHIDTLGNTVYKNKIEKETKDNTSYLVFYISGYKHLIENVDDIFKDKEAINFGYKGAVPGLGWGRSKLFF